eukprot:NODE_309_length_11266_cov_0.459479.p8 type:complete len:144 gc:universal NODE_309_length_11266_cov_0.459479:617-186(-)
MFLQVLSVLAISAIKCGIATGNYFTSLTFNREIKNVKINAICVRRVFGNCVKSKEFIAADEYSDCVTLVKGQRKGTFTNTNKDCGVAVGGYYSKLVNNKKVSKITVFTTCVITNMIDCRDGEITADKMVTNLKKNCTPIEYIK